METNFKKFLTGKSEEDVKKEFMKLDTLSKARYITEKDPDMKEFMPSQEEIKKAYMDMVDEPHTWMVLEEYKNGNIKVWDQITRDPVTREKAEEIRNKAIKDKSPVDETHYFVASWSAYVMRLMEDEIY